MQQCASSSSEPMFTDLLSISDAVDDDASLRHSQPLQLYGDDRSQGRQPLVSSTTDTGRQRRSRDGQPGRARKRDTKSPEITDSKKPRRRQSKSAFRCVGSLPSDHYFRSVCWSVCLLVQSFSRPCLIRFRSHLDICYMSGSSCVP